MTENIDELHRRIKELEKQVAYLNDQLKQDDKFGLHWIDVPEAFDKESENKIPILEEVPELAITNDDGKPTHILIEGDNYHALTCLNYTHHGKVDVIYIDPPYNTGSDGFTYKDKRFLDKFPDGAKLPANHPLRHSSWLSFMEKRLKQAKELLADKGVIFISIDDNEQANLKLLCDKVFGCSKFMGLISRATGTTTGQDTGSLGKACDYILAYSKEGGYQIGGLPLTEKDLSRYDMVDEKGNYSILQLRRTGGEDRREDRPTMFFPIIAPDGTEVYPYGPTGYESRWRVGPDKVIQMRKNNLLYFKKGKNGEWKVYYKFYAEGKTKRPSNLWNDLDGNKKAQIELKSIIPNVKFETPKPIQVIKRVLEITSTKSSIILDFFAGSGTTLHATMKLNAEDGGHRQCVLVNSNEDNICRDVTYERNKCVIEGYSKEKPLGNSLKYYRTAFVGSNTSNNATDEDKTLLAQKAGCLLALAENTLYEQKRTDNYQIFKDKDRDVWTVVYFKEDVRPKFFNAFVEDVANLSGKKNVYIFSWGDVSSFESYFDGISGVCLKGIPQPILDIYKSLNS